MPQMIIYIELNDYRIKSNKIFIVFHILSVKNNTK